VVVSNPPRFRVRHNCAFALCAAIAARNRQLAWEVFRNFDWTLAVGGLCTS
jgi:hypothetical protein